MKCLIVDDEELARTLITTHLEKIDFIELVGSFDSPLKALNLLNEQDIDLIFLDIQMPDLKGTDFAKLIKGKTQVIFTTAYSEFALEGFELDAIDYLLKPITFDRFLQAINKVKHTAYTPKTHITIKSGYDLHKVAFEDIYFIKSDSEYVVFYTINGKIMAYQSLKSLDKELPTNKFMRVHRSFIVNKQKVEALKDRDLLINGERIPVSATYFEAVKSKLFH